MMPSPPNLQTLCRGNPRVAPTEGRAFFFLLLLICAVSFARNGTEPLNFYGLATLEDKDVGLRLAGRFKARGQPVFLIHDPNAGLGQGDIVRFTDKVVLVDADVWNTLQSEGALEKLKTVPLIRVQGQLRGGSWEQRAGLVNNDRERKAFRLGAELIRVLEETFGGAPLRNQMTIVFRDGQITLLAPADLLDQLRISPVRKVAQTGSLHMVSVPPDSDGFVGRPFDFQVWAVDPTEPAAALTYRMIGELPPGLLWDPELHKIRGTPAGLGVWRLKAEVRNLKGVHDSLAFTLRFRINQPPTLTGSPKPMAIANSDWSFRPLPSDPDHPGYDLKVKARSLPTGMEFISDSLVLRWKPDSNFIGTRQEFFLSVEDPLGALKEFKYNVQVISANDISWSEGVKVDLPWDSLLTGRNYFWQAGATATAWAAQGITLQNVEGSDSTLFDGNQLRLRPMAVGMHRFDFHFLIQGVSRVQRVFLPVHEDHPPIFLTELTDWKAQAGDRPLRYRPAAIDPDGEPVTLSVELPEGSPLQWDGKILNLSASVPGIYPARFTATDLGGKAADQWIAFRATPPDRKVRWILENRMQAGMTVWSIAADFGTGRIGLYTPNLNKVLSLSNQYGRELPFFFVGGNLMGRQNEAKGRRLWTDFGFTVRNPDPNIATGGVYARILGEWAFSHSPLAMVEMEFSAHVHQAMVLADTGSFRLLMRDKDITSLVEEYSGVVESIVSDAVAKENAVFYTRFEALASSGTGFFFGPGLWREDWPMVQELYQRMGGTIRYRYSTGQWIINTSLRAGWGPGGSGWDAHAALRVSLGSKF